MSEYQRVLNEWALEKIPNAEGAVVVTDVSFDFSQGYGGGCDTCGYGADEDKMNIWIEFRKEDGSIGRHETSQEMYSFESSMGEIMRELFAIAEKED